MHLTVMVWPLSSGQMGLHLYPDKGKRIRPLELGPFDYDHGSHTDLLWISEGFTVYYEYLLAHRAGLSTSEECLQQLNNNLLAYETKTGKQFQLLAEDSAISYYDKGPVIALLLDLQIWHSTGNIKSLDNVMRTLYRTYYKERHRGFTSAEFQRVCEQTAGTSLAPLFEYVNTVKPVDYGHYLAFAGPGIDSSYHIYSLPAKDKLQSAICQSIF